MDLGRLGRFFAESAHAADGAMPSAASIGNRLCEACVELLDVGDAGILLVAEDGGVSCFATAGPTAVGVVEDLQFTLGEGPGLDAHASGRPVFEPDLADPARAMWPVFAPAAVRAGVYGMFSFPLRTSAVRLGALDLSCTTRGDLNRQQRLDGTVLAVIVAEQLLAAQADADPGSLARKLDDARTLRHEVHQAAGMVSEQLDIRTGDALVLLRAAAYAAERPIDDLAHDVVARRLRFDDPHT